jgi:hypothetical protein
MGLPFNPVAFESVNVHVYVGQVPADRLPVAVHGRFDGPHMVEPPIATALALT